MPCKAKSRAPVPLRHAKHTFYTPCPLSPSNSLLKHIHAICLDDITHSLLFYFSGFAPLTYWPVFQLLLSDSSLAPPPRARQISPTRSWSVTLKGYNQWKSTTLGAHLIHTVGQSWFKGVDWVKPHFISTPISHPACALYNPLFWRSTGSRFFPFPSQSQSFFSTTW